MKKKIFDLGFIMICIFLGLLLVLTLIVNVSAITYNTFNNSLTAENLTLNQTINVTRYLTTNAGIFNNATFNISGYGNLSWSSLPISCSFSACSGYGNDVDGNFDTSSQICNSGRITYENITIPNTLTELNWSVRFDYYKETTDSNINNISIYCFNYSNSNYKLIYNFSNGDATGSTLSLYKNITIPDDCFVGNSSIKLKTDYNILGATGFCSGNYKTISYYEGRLLELPDYTSSPINTKVYINNTLVFSKSGELGLNNNLDIVGYLNSYLSVCNYTSGNCSVPFIFSSESESFLEYFSINFTSPEGIILENISYNVNTYETKRELFTLNISYDNIYYPVATAKLYYNGTPYIGDITNSYGNYIFSKYLDIPLINSNEENKTFYWEVSLTNSLGTYVYNTSSYNQTVNQINLGDCGGLNSSLALNITAYNEKTLDRINPFSIAGTLTYAIGNSSLTKTYSFGNTSLNEKNICISVNTTYTINGLVSYSNDSFQPSTFYFLDYPISNLTKDFALYLLPVASSTSFILQVQDQNILPLTGYSIKVNRYYPAYNTYQTVQVVRTDENGQSIAFLETETVDYQFLIYDTNNNLVYTSDRRKIIPQSTPYTITFTVGALLPSPLSYLENLTDLTYSLTYDKTTHKVTYTYADSNSSFTSSRLIVSALNLSGSNNILCNSSLTTPSGVIICDLTGNLSGSYSATAYIFRDSQNFIDNIIFEINTFADTSGLLGVMGGFFILLIVAFLFPYSPVASILTLDVGVIFLNLIGFVQFGSVFITAIIGISVLIIIVLERD